LNHTWSSTITRGEETSLFVFLDKFGGSFGFTENIGWRYEALEEISLHILTSTLEISSL
jgi:hypothetical protein